MNQVLYRDVWIPHVLLAQKRRFLKKLFHLTLHNLIQYLFRFSHLYGLRPVNILFPLYNLLGDILSTNAKRSGRSNVHGQILDKRTELIILSHKIGLAVHFYQDTNLATRVDI